MTVSSKPAPLDLEQFKGHTPGPWKLSRRDGVAHGDSTNLGWDWDMENPPIEPHRGVVSLEADARLIAAAPTLLARLKDAEDALAWYGEQARLARLIHSGGDAGRAALAADGGKRARSHLQPDSTGEKE